MVKNISDELDRIDIRILSVLQRDGKLAVADLAERVGLSPSACWRRIRQMEESGVIEDRVTLLSGDALGLDFIVFAIVKLTIPSQEALQEFEKLVMTWPEVMDCYTITGAADYMLRIVTTDIHAYDTFLRTKLLAAGKVSDVQSRIVVANVKQSTALPLELIAVT